MESLPLWKTLGLYYCYYLLYLLYSLLLDFTIEEFQFSDSADYSPSYFVLFLACVPKKMGVRDGAMRWDASIRWFSTHEVSTS